MWLDYKKLFYAAVFFLLSIDALSETRITNFEYSLNGTLLNHSERIYDPNNYWGLATNYCLVNETVDDRLKQQPFECTLRDVNQIQQAFSKSRVNTADSLLNASHIIKKNGDEVYLNSSGQEYSALSMLQQYYENLRHAKQLGSNVGSQSSWDKEETLSTSISPFIFDKPADMQTLDLFNLENEAPEAERPSSAIFFSLSAQGEKALSFSANSNENVGNTNDYTKLLNVTSIVLNRPDTDALASTIFNTSNVANANRTPVSSPLSATLFLIGLYVVFVTRRSHKEKQYVKQQK